MATPFRGQHWPVSRSGGKFQNRWGKVSEKLPTDWRNDSEKSQSANTRLRRWRRDVPSSPAASAKPSLYVIGRTTRNPGGLLGYTERRLNVSGWLFSGCY